MAEITKQDYAKAIDTYISSKINTFKSPDNPDKWEWEFIEGMPDPKQPDLTRYTKEINARECAIKYIKENNLEAYEIAKTEAREWMKYNNHTTI